VKKVVIYTDGACSGNPGPGGYAAILRYKNREMVVSGGDPSTTNNRMELLAAIEALKKLKEPCEVSLHSDSAYLVNGMLKWIDKWLANGWKTAAKKKVENRELWESLLALSSKHEMKWLKVAGHSGNPENERCDVLARDEISKLVW
jgi:ribonuclease HI